MSPIRHVSALLFPYRLFMQKIMPVSGSLQANFAWTLVGNVVYAGCQWGMLVVLAKLSSPEMVGQFALALAVTAPIITFSNLKLRALLTVDVRREFLFDDYLVERILTSLLAVLIAAGIALVAGYAQSITVLIVLSAFTRCFDGISDIIYGLHQQNEKMSYIGQSQILQGILQLSSIGLVVALSGSLVWGMVALALVSATTTFTYDLPNATRVLGRPIRLRWRPGNLLRLTQIGLPLGLSVTFGILRVNIPRYIVQMSAGDRELGVFAAISGLAIAGITVVTALGQASSPRLARLALANNWLEFDRLLRRLMLLGGSVGAFGVLIVTFAGRDILALLYQPEYGDYAHVLLILMIACALQFTYVFCGTAIQAMRNFIAELPIRMLGCLLVALLALLLVPSWGATGAAYAVLITTLIEAVVFGVVLLNVRYRVRRQS